MVIGRFCGMLVRCIRVHLQDADVSHVLLQSASSRLGSFRMMRRKTSMCRSFLPMLSCQQNTLRVSNKKLTFGICTNLSFSLLRDVFGWHFLYEEVVKDFRSSSCRCACKVRASTAYSVKKPIVRRDESSSDDTTYVMAVTYELRNDVDRHIPPVELKLELPVGSTIYDVMVEAAQKDWRCGFGAVPNADWGFQIDSVGGVAGSSEKGTFWSVERPAYHPITEAAETRILAQQEQQDLNAFTTFLSRKFQPKIFLSRL
uniref:Uncharacterized protein n=1 Tax=Branchiostoma floridae TaxID=7739 RepID=C3XV26_BRAFL|eukprot:XP_002611943.1 hypothetical protein BRAFLDRAFT_91827 [Branchiostoma floridae]